MAKNKPNRLLNQSFNKDAPVSDTQLLTISLVAPPQVTKYIAQAVVRMNIIGIDANCFAERFFRFVAPRQVSQNIAQAVVRIGIIGIDANCFAERFFRLAEPPQVSTNIAQAAVPID